MKKNHVVKWILSNIFIMLVYGMFAYYSLSLLNKHPHYFWWIWTGLSAGFAVCVSLMFITLTHQREHALIQYDILTGLPNRPWLLSKITQAVAEANIRRRIIAVCFIDIDNFKQINDNFGHHIGDKLLKEIANIIHSKIKKRDLIARLSGDEFGLIIQDADNHLEEFLKNILDAVNQSIIIDDIRIIRSVSIGAALYPFSSENPEELIRLADIAMYRAKETGKNNFKIYNQHLHKITQRKLRIDHYLNQAIKNNEFYLLYQPQIDFITNKIVGIEALVYWYKSELGGRVFPAEFIPVAEDNGLIYPIGEWVLKRAAFDFKEFCDRCQLDYFTLSINVSMNQLRDERFYGLIQKTMDEMKIKPNRFTLEIAETALDSHLKKNIKMMHEFKKLNIQFALDNFGTGFFSIEFLRSLPLSILKIDKSLVHHIAKNEVIIHSILHLARALNIKTLAEGVETAEQYAFFKNHGCELGQGFYFAKPMPIRQLIQFVIKVSQPS